MTTFVTGDCRTCVHNTYVGKDVGEWVSCSHPVTVSKTPKPEPGDPAWVNMLTGDVQWSRLDEVADCPCYSALTPTKEGE